MKKFLSPIVDAPFKFIVPILLIILGAVNIRLIHGQPINLTFPDLPTHRLYTNAPATIRWTGGLQNATLRIEYSVDNGVTYKYTLANNIPVSSGSQRVVIPGKATEMARIRIRINNVGTVDTATFDQSQNPIKTDYTNPLCVFCSPSGNNANTYNFSMIEIRDVAANASIMRYAPASPLRTSPYLDNYMESTTFPRLIPGRSYDFSCSLSGTGSKTVGIWLDLDNDCQYGTAIASTGNVSELLVSRSTTGGNIVLRVTIPFGTANIARRLRIRLLGSSTVSVPSFTLNEFCSASKLVGKTVVNTGQTIDFRAVGSSGSREAIDLESSIEENTENTFVVYPNPGTQHTETHIQFSDIVTSVMHLDITDYTGKKVYSHTIEANNQNEVSFKLPKGFYLIRLADEHKTMSRKLIIQ